MTEDSRAPVEAQPASGAEQSGGLNRKNRREKRQQEFLREHTDESGKVRPDLCQKGIEQLKEMKSAAGIDQAPSGDQRETPATSEKGE